MGKPTLPAGVSQGCIERHTLILDDVLDFGHSTIYGAQTAENHGCKLFQSFRRSKGVGNMYWLWM